MANIEFPLKNKSIEIFANPYEYDMHLEYQFENFRADTCRSRIFIKRSGAWIEQYTNETATKDQMWVGKDFKDKAPLRYYYKSNTTSCSELESLAFGNGRTLWNLYAQGCDPGNSFNDNTTNYISMGINPNNPQGDHLQVLPVNITKSLRYPEPPEDAEYTDVPGATFATSKREFADSEYVPNQIYQLYIPSSMTSFTLKGSDAEDMNQFGISSESDFIRTSDATLEIFLSPKFIESGLPEVIFDSEDIPETQIKFYYFEEDSSNFNEWFSTIRGSNPGWNLTQPVLVIFESNSKVGWMIKDEAVKQAQDRIDVFTNRYLETRYYDFIDLVPTSVPEDIYGGMDVSKVVITDYVTDESDLPSPDGGGEGGGGNPIK